MRRNPDSSAASAEFGNLTVLLGYVRNLLGNAKVVRFLSTRHAEMLAEFEWMAAKEGV